MWGRCFEGSKHRKLFQIQLYYYLTLIWSLPWLSTPSSSSACHMPTAWERVSTQALCITNQSTSSVPTQHCLQHTHTNTHVKQTFGIIYKTAPVFFYLKKLLFNGFTVLLIHLKRTQLITYLYVLRWYFLSRIMCGALDRMALRSTFPALLSFSEGI